MIYNNFLKKYRKKNKIKKNECMWFYFIKVLKNLFIYKIKKNI